MVELSRQPPQYFDHRPAHPETMDHYFSWAARYSHRGHQSMRSITLRVTQERLDKRDLWHSGLNEVGGRVWWAFRWVFIIKLVVNPVAADKQCAPNCTAPWIHLLPW